MDDENEELKLLHELTQIYSKHNADGKCCACVICKCFLDTKELIDEEEYLP